jgi:hypothetical protein
MRAAILLAFALSGCATSVSHSVAGSIIHVQQRHFYFVDDTAPSQHALQRAVDSAVAGDDAQLAYVISLVRHTDGEGAENYGDLLLDIRRAVTARRFQQVLATLDPKTREIASGCMDVAQHLRGYARGPNQT